MSLTSDLALTSNLGENGVKTLMCVSVSIDFAKLYIKCFIVVITTNSGSRLTIGAVCTDCHSHQLNCMLKLTFAYHIRTLTHAG